MNADGNVFPGSELPPVTASAISGLPRSGRLHGLSEYRILRSGTIATDNCNRSRVQGSFHPVRRFSGRPVYDDSHTISTVS